MSGSSIMLDHAAVPSQSRSRLRRFMSDPRAPLAIVLVVVLAALSVPPILMLVQSSIAEVGSDGMAIGWTMQHFRDLFSDPKLVGTIFASVVFAAGSACVSLLVGGVLSWLVERTDAPFKQLASLTAIISMGTPYILYVVAWLFLLGRVGPLNELYRMATGDTGVIFNVNSMAGMILIEGFLWSPLVFLMLSATFRAANADMEEAARISGASVAQTIRRVTLPLSMPSIIALALFVFIRALEALEVPLLVGMPGNINLLTTDVYESTQQMPPDLGYSSAFALLLLVFVAVLFSLYGRISKNADRYQSVTGKAFRPRPFHLGRARGLAGAFIFGVFLIVLLLPLLALVWLSLLPYTNGFSLRILPFLNLDNYRAVLAHPYYLGLAVNTILVSACAATFVVAITAVAGWLAARRGPGHWLIDQLATLPLVFPGIVMGVAVMQIVLYLPIPVYGTLWAIMIAYVIRYMPYGMRYSYSGVLQVHRELEEAAGVSGASLALTLRRVMMPLLSPALLASWIFVFLICSKELSVAVLLAGPKSQVIAVAMLDLWVNGQGGELSAFGLLWTVVIALVALVFLRFGQEQASGAFR